MYKDISIDFDKLNPITGDIGSLKDSNAVRNSVRNLITSSFDVTPFERERGCGIDRLLFEQNSHVVRFEAKRMIKQ